MKYRNKNLIKNRKHIRKLLPLGEHCVIIDTSANMQEKYRGDNNMASSTKAAFASALKQIMNVKPMNKITVKDLVELCGVNRQTFYYHFNDVYDLLEWVFEEDANRILPKEIVYDRWREDVLAFFEYLFENHSFALNVYNSNRRLYMLRFLQERLESCIRGFAEIVCDGHNIDRQDYEFTIAFYANGIVGLISRWLDADMPAPTEANKQRFIIMLENSVENMLFRFGSGK